MNEICVLISDAGGIGTFMNLDNFAQTVTWAKVLGIPDAGE